jgi:hypothetical protein
MLKEYEPRLVVIADTPEDYSLNAPFSRKFNKEVFFGAVQIKKNYVSFHLMLVYMHPELLVDLSNGLKKRMQGKSCFNFTVYDEDLLAELARLTRTSVEWVRREKIY